MSREIKFRAWDKERGKYSWGGSNVMMDLGGALFWQFAYDAPVRLDYPSNFSVEQFTGLHDKNGREIYEGDIIRLFTGRQADSEAAGMDPLRWAFVIEFKDACFGYRGANPDLHHEDDIEFKPICRDGETHLCEPEVIGNIHENKELLR